MERTLQWMMRQRHGGSRRRMHTKADGVDFLPDGVHVFEFEVQQPEPVEHEVGTSAMLADADATDQIEVYREALSVRRAMARKHYGHDDNERLAIGRAKLLWKSLDVDDETHLGLVGLGVLERTRSIKKVQLAGDDMNMSAAKSERKRKSGRKTMSAAKSEVKHEDQSSMWQKFARKPVAAQARLGSFCRYVKSTCTPSSTFVGFASSTRSQRARAGRPQADERVRSGFRRVSRCNQARVNPAFDPVEPHPDATSSSASFMGPWHRP
eukprot:TRINITY_DN15523_c0_g3_i1.p1 TRINITY_DN15523_c0_g3~~TRINITY_DN15523_c0_g3_i1.p1  ORF type:complete len:283 (+),score=20.67 TRINITY_DN15523_c0_g3_i1:49-849(+)